MRIVIIALIIFAALLAVATACGGANDGPLVVAVTGNGETREASTEPIALKDAKLNIEHNATDNDTGFQGLPWCEGLNRPNSAPPASPLRPFAGRGKLATL